MFPLRVVCTPGLIGSDAFGGYGELLLVSACCTCPQHTALSLLSMSSASSFSQLLKHHVVWLCGVVFTCLVSYMSWIKPHSCPRGFSPTWLFSLPCGKNWWCFCFSSCASDIQQSWTSLTSLQFSSSPPGITMCWYFYVFLFLRSCITWVSCWVNYSLMYWHFRL